MIDYLKHTIDGKPMESFMKGKLPTVQNTPEWIAENKRQKEHAKFIDEMVSMFKDSTNTNTQEVEE